MRFLFATRYYSDVDPATGEWFEVKDRMYRTVRGRFIIVKGPEKPGGPEIEESYSLKRVFEWLREFPWQIERTVIVNRNLCPQT